MITKEKYQTYLQILKEELVPAMGCTEPVAIAYAGALAAQLLREAGESVQTATIGVSGNIIKNVKSVIVPHTGGLRGIESALAAGIAVGAPEKQLQVLSCVKEEDLLKIRETLKSCPIEVQRLENGAVFEILVVLRSQNHTATVRIVDQHTNVVLKQIDGKTLYKNEAVSAVKKVDRSCLTVEEIVEFADTVKIEDVREVLQRQIDCNMAIAEEGLKNEYGANIGKVYLHAYPNDIIGKAKAYAAAGSDARMNGCEMPVIINSGSGNQGITTSVPVIVYAREKKLPTEILYRALCVSNLVTVHLKSGIGTLSAYCGVVSAGAGAGCGVAYLLGGKFREIAHTLVNALAMDSGMICDGAKASCAAKIALAVESGLVGLEMYHQGNQFYAGDGIVKKGVERTIESVSRLAHDGMQETDKEIIRIMIEDC
ncbi:MAG: serine dehydratase subunit alpha family protein [Clostridia bacterium]|nr:serine dehydratase subunit alpha family protein [Clostridia bacterium]